MRLICPECNALYDIDEAMIPVEGREVECSACGHVWLQLREAGEAAPEPEPAPAPEAPRGLSGDLRAAARDDQAAAPELGEAPVLQRPLPDDVLSILREETARELGARRASRTGPEAEAVPAPAAPEAGDEPAQTPDTPAPDDLSPDWPATTLTRPEPGPRADSPAR
ncbi:MAG: zinc-ribbon domain-containing protein, partial [Paracoccus sp. (in: a-proteobacteria)]|nr:zinc-ribbon domain-containing protein [Paracoccus sp. (in: a-proteobacteria)]